MPYLGNDLITADRTAEIDTKILTSVSTAVSDLVDAAPAALNTLNELAASLGDDANFAATVTNALALKADQTSITAVNNNLATKADKTNVLALNNTTAYSPTSNYHPATKGYVDALASSGGGNVSITKGFAFTGNGSSTTFDCGAASSYILGAVDVYYNGFQLASTDYTAADGRNFTVNFTPENGALLKLVAYGGADVYNKTQTDTLLGAKANSGDVTTSLALKANLAGADFTGASSITGVPTDGVGILKLIASSNPSNWTYATSAVNANMTASQHFMHFIGKSMAINNAAGFGFKYAADGQATNKLSLGMYGKDDAFLLDGNGYIRKPYQPFFSGTASYSTAYSGSLSPMKFTDVDVNNGNHYSTTTGYFTCPVDGWYEVTAQGHVQNNAGYTTLQLYHGGTMVSNAWNNVCSSEITATVIRYCGANDTLYAAMGTNQTNYIAEKYWKMTVKLIG